MSVRALAGDWWVIALVLLNLVCVLHGGEVGYFNAFVAGLLLGGLIFKHL